MKRLMLSLILAGAALAGGASTVEAGWSIGVAVGGPVYFDGIAYGEYCGYRRPVYYYRPVYYQPCPVYYAPPLWSCRPPRPIHCGRKRIVEPHVYRGGIVAR